MSLGIGFGKTMRPPEDIITIMNKLLDLIMKHDDSYEKKVLERMPNNARMGFLDPSNIYHSYYQQLKHERVVTSNIEKAGLTALPSTISSQNTTENLVVERKATLSQLPNIPLPPPLRFAIDTPKHITPIELETIRLTAQYIAEKGRIALENIHQEKSQDPQFEFLNPSSSRNAYFVSILRQYQEVGRQNESTLTQIKNEAANQQLIYQRVKQRAMAERVQEIKQKREERLRESEKYKTRQIDWHDFIVIQTIEFDELTITPNQSMRNNQAAIAASAGVLVAPEDGATVMSLPSHSVSASGQSGGDEMEVEMEDEFVAAPLHVQPTVRTQICPFCKKPIPETEIAQHIKYETMDQHERNKRLEAFQKTRSIPLAEDDEMLRTVSNFAKNRPDLTSAAIGSGSGLGNEGEKRFGP
ncbi:putative Splicing factor 3A subunit 1 [Blattamonas nauphoetae]|uniref:Splicing factor 3A subunit 1 n=1 Tax=Blattamonas nauphoetae TaxID=2049346 RepID=A0ABQ9XS70_9EUKA|nr:putative Splicing factor 3A subunit 1 [Blattamonas nauphoetae]